MSAARSGPGRKATKVGPRLREIARTREVVCDFLAGDNQYRSTAGLLDAYFLAFAIAARRHR
jgi:hypothetical protein